MHSPGIHGTGYSSREHSWCETILDKGLVVDEVKSYSGKQGKQSENGIEETGMYVLGNIRYIIRTVTKWPSNVGAWYSSTRGASLYSLTIALPPSILAGRLAYLPCVAVDKVSMWMCMMAGQVVFMNSTLGLNYIHVHVHVHVHVPVFMQRFAY